MQVLANVLGWILDKISAVWLKLTQLAVAAFLAIWDLLQDLFCWVIDSCLGLVISVISVFDFSGLTVALGAWASLPVITIEVLEAVGLTTAFGLVVTAIGIRIVLQLIPFTRLGS